MDKLSRYANLIEERRACRACAGLVNPAAVAGGLHDAEAIGPWTAWQGNLNAPVMLVGQDYSDVAYFERRQGIEDLGNPTNKALVKLFESIGIRLTAPGERNGGGEVFFTNAILCLKSGGMQASVRSEWFATCGSRFLKRQIELVSPGVTIGLGARAYAAVLSAFGLPRELFVHATRSMGTTLPTGGVALAVYHCGRRVTNGIRPFEQQLIDWTRIGRVLREQKRIPPIGSTTPSGPAKAPETEK
jgi:DNA polymerase